MLGVKLQTRSNSSRIILLRSEEYEKQIQFAELTKKHDTVRKQKASVKINTQSPSKCYGIVKKATSNLINWAQSSGWKFRAASCWRSREKSCSFRKIYVADKTIGREYAKQRTLPAYRESFLQFY